MSSFFPLLFLFFPGAKERNVAPQLTDFEIPTSFWYELKSLTETLMDNVNRESSYVRPKHMFPRRSCCQNKEVLWYLYYGHFLSQRVIGSIAKQMVLSISDNLNKYLYSYLFWGANWK